VTANARAVHRDKAAENLPPDVPHALPTTDVRLPGRHCFGLRNAGHGVVDLSPRVAFNLRENFG